MPIKITTTDFITEMNMKDVVSYYNTYMKMTCNDMNSVIELIEYKNGTKINYGFCIKSTEHKNIYINYEYKYMRWENKTLVALINYPSFSHEDEYILYKIMRFTIGKEQVTYYSSYEQTLLANISVKPDETISISNNKRWRQICKCIRFELYSGN